MSTTSSAARHAGRTGVGLAVVATAVGVGVPAHAQPPVALAPALGGAVPMPQSPSSSPSMTYRVESGDTLSGIAARTGSSVSAIASANDLGSPDRIREGQMLRIPSAASSASESGGSESGSGDSGGAENGSGSLYQVQPGDTLSGIASRHNTTAARLAEINDLASPDRIRAGQTLRLDVTARADQTDGAEIQPASETSSSADGQSHTVQAGDTVWSLASRYGTTVDAIVRANNLGSDALIYVGQTLNVGGASAPAESSGGAESSGSGESSGASSSGSEGATSYTVTAGDTVSGIAARFGVPSQAIVNANDLGAAATIYAGQTLTVPTATNLVGDTFEGRTYAPEVVASANVNKATLLSMDIPSRAEMQAMVARVASEMGVDPVLAQAHAFQESGFNHASVSPANAIGTMQVIPSSGEWASDLVGRELNLLDPYDNVVAGVAIIRHLHRAADSYDDAIAAYYQGLGGVNRHGWYEDTERYVAAVKAHMSRF